MAGGYFFIIALNSRVMSDISFSMDHCVHIGGLNEGFEILKGDAA